MRRLVLLLLFLLTPISLAKVAAGHGGRFRSPFPVGGRGEPARTPPPPPPPPQPPAPRKDGSIPPPVVTPTGSLPQPLSIDDWFFWWQLNAAQYETVRWRMHYTLDGPSPLFVTDAGELDRTRWSRAPVAKRVLPALLRVVDPEAEVAPHVVASALLALGKLAESPVHVAALLRALDVEAGRPCEVRAAAALGLGLLRRERRDRQIVAGLLDAARATLLACLEEEGLDAGLRVRAAQALGLLGDQPTEGGLEGCRRNVARLLEAGRLQGGYGEVGAASLRAIGRHPPEAVSGAQRATLRTCVWKGRLGDSRVVELARAGAAFALGRIGGSDDLAPLSEALVARRGVGRRTQRSIAVALGRLASRVGQRDRRRIEVALLHVLDRSKDVATCNLATLSLARVLVAGLHTEPPDGLDVHRAGDVLLRLARKGGDLHRGFAFLALGHLLRQVPGDEGDDALYAWCEEARVALRDAAASSRVAVRLRAAAITALGMARDSPSREHLLATFEDETLPEAIRCAAARAYGMLYEDPGYRGLKRFRRALAEDDSVGIRHAALRAHALLGHPMLAVKETDGVDRVLADLSAADSARERAAAILLLAHDADYRALVPLVESLENRALSDETRALAAAALGCVGDSGWMPSLDRLREDVSFRSVGVETGWVFRLH